MEVTKSVINVVERAYDVDSPAASWLEGIRQAAERSFCGQLAVQAYTFQIYGTGDFQLAEMASEPFWAESFRRLHAVGRPDVIRQIYLNGPVRSLCAALSSAALTRREGELVHGETSRAGIRDVWGALGVDPGGMGCGLVFLEPTASRLSRSTRQALARIAAHLASVRRLRGSLEQQGSRGDALAGADAVLGTGGRVLHAEGTARSREARLALREAARRIERARLRSQSGTPGVALGLWRALVEGRWSLVERFESDGRRILIARRNDPGSRDIRVLNELERKVVALLAVGRSLKVCAYELGRAQSTIHEVAGSAMSKMGVHSRAALVELHGALVCGPIPGAPAGGPGA